MKAHGHRERSITYWGLLGRAKAGTLGRGQVEEGEQGEKCQM